MAIIIENYPDQRSFANGLYMMLSFILQSLAVLLIGFLSDIVSLRFAFYICTAVLPTGLLFISLLPKPQYHPAEL
jgi:MFS family permease